MSFPNENICQASHFNATQINASTDEPILSSNKVRVSHPSTYGLDDYFLRNQEETGSQPRLRICFDPEQVQI